MEFSTAIRARTNQERVEQSTLRLMHAAIALFAEKGYERTTAAEIGTRAGYSRNMVRDRYGSKDALLEALVEREFAELLLPSVRKERQGSGLDLVLGQCDDLRTAVEEQPGAMRALVLLSFEAPGALEVVRPWLDTLIASFEAELVEHLADGVGDGSIRKGLDLAREGEVFVTYAIGLCYRWVLRSGYDFPAEIGAWRERLTERLSPTLRPG